MKVSLDFHDFSVGNHQIFYLEQLREHYPDMKVSMFFIPADAQYEGKFLDYEKDKIKERIKQYVEDGWIELIPHGVSHIFGEFKKATYNDMLLAMDAYHEYFTSWGVPYIKGFCAPNWLISDEVIKCLDDKGWWLAVDRNQPDLKRAKRFYEYNWSIDTPCPDFDTILGHGHISGPSTNSLTENLHNILTIPPEAEWKFVSQIMQEKGEKHEDSK